MIYNKRRSMRLPYSGNAVIPREKLTKYLLSETHATGKFKARFFRSFGFNEINVDVLENSIRELSKGAISEESVSSYGTKYAINGKIDTPIGKSIKVRTVWIIEKGQKRPRFITVYPV